MIRVYDYGCANGHVQEVFAQAEDHSERPCEVCGEPAQRQLSAPAFILEGHSGHFPGRAMKWEAEHEKAGRGSHDVED